MIDLRSDTVTRPTAGMREAMANAQVGDDVYGEDPTVRALEEEVAALLGKEAALFVPSGTMSNQIALLLHTRPGDEVLVARAAHMLEYESGAAAALSGVQLKELGDDGAFTVADVVAAVRPERDYHPRTRLVAVENTHNRSGGRVFSQKVAVEIGRAAATLRLGSHLDGARLWNAAVATGHSLAELAAPFDSVSVCFSKGLGAPVGSALVGARDAIRAARRHRKMLGGGMRQAGVIAAAARYAIAHHRERLAVDHANARRIAEELRGAPGIELRPEPIETNMVVLRFPTPGAEAIASKLAERGVLVSVVSPRVLRLVTHLDVDEAAVTRAARLLCELLETEQRSGSP